MPLYGHREMTVALNASSLIQLNTPVTAWRIPGK